jgi:hypothetical protein
VHLQYNTYLLGLADDEEGSKAEKAGEQKS